MSGGERQRLGLARAWPANRLLVLDDATSQPRHRDRDADQPTLTEDRQRRTRLIVTHRPATAARADLVVWLEHGRVRAVAPHADLWQRHVVPGGLRVKRELRTALGRCGGGLRLRLVAWSVPEILPTAIYGVAVAQATDSFLAGHAWQGIAWLGGLVARRLVWAPPARARSTARLGDLVEPVRDDLVRRVVAGALRTGDDSAVARLNRQVEIVRDTFAGLVLVIRSFAVTLVGVLAGLLSLAPLVAAFVVPPFLLGFALSLGVLGMAADRVRASLQADEELAASAGMVFGGVRDITATGAEEYAEFLVGRTDRGARGGRAGARQGRRAAHTVFRGRWLGSRC